MKKGRTARVEWCRESRVIEERWAEGRQTGDVGGNNIGVGGYLYLQKCRWAQAKGSHVCLDILWWKNWPDRNLWEGTILISTLRISNVLLCVKKLNLSLMVCRTLNPPVWKLFTRNKSEIPRNAFALNNLDSFRMGRGKVYHTVAVSIKLRANISYYC